VKQCRSPLTVWQTEVFFYYICYFSIFPSNFIDSESGVKYALNRKTGHVTSSSTRDHSTQHRPLPTYWWYFGTKPASPVVFEILASKSIGVKTTFQGHVMSSVTWPFDSKVAIFYRHSIVTKSLSQAIFEIMGIKHIGVMTLTFQGHVTSSVTWPFDSQGPISYRHSMTA